MNMNKRKIICFACFCIFFAALPISFAISISPSFVRLDFEPDLKKNITFHVDGPGSLEPYISDDLVEYAKISDIKERDNGKMYFEVFLSLPQTLPSGEYRLTVGIRESQSKQGFFSASAAVQAPVIIYVPEKVAETQIVEEEKPATILRKAGSDK